MQQNMLEFSLDALEDADVFGPGEEALGRIDRLVRSNNAYVVMNIDTGWFDAGATAVVPLQRFLDGRRPDAPRRHGGDIGEYSPYGGVYGGFWNAGVSEIDPGYYNTIGDIYECDA